MQASNSHQKVGQIFNWFLDCAADGTHSSSGIPKTREYLIGRRGLIDDYIDGEFRRRRFADVTRRGVGLKVLSGEGASIDTTTANGRLVFAIFAGLAEFERELISERTRAGLASARARGRSGGRPFKMTAAKIRLAQAAVGKPETSVRDLCAELGITRQTLYRFVGPKGELRPDAEKLLARRKPKA